MVILGFAIGVVWVVRGIAFDPTLPIRNHADVQPRVPGGMRFDTFHEGERIAFLPIFERGPTPFESSFMIHGFGIDAAPSIVADNVASGEQRIVAVRWAVMLELLIAAVASLLLMAELSAAQHPGRRLQGFVTGLVILVCLVPTPFVHLALVLLQCVIIVRFVRLAKSPQNTGQLAALALVLGLSLPMGLLYSYTGLVVSLAVTAVATGFVVATRSGAVRTWVFSVGGGAAVGVAILVLAVGDRAVLALVDQVVYWARNGLIVWDRPLTRFTGPADLLIPSLLAALICQVALIIWLIWQWQQRTSARDWLRDTTIGWIILGFAVAGTRDAIDRGGPDFGSRALLASAFCLAFAAIKVGERWRPRWASLTGTVALSVILVVVSTRPMSPPPDQSEPGSAIVPAAFEEVARSLDGVVPKDGCTYTLTSEGLWYFVLDRPACSRFHHLLYARTRDAQQMVIDDLATRQPERVIFSSDTAPPVDDISIFSTNAPIVRWVLLNYEPDAYIDGVWIWRRRTARLLLAPTGPSEDPPLARLPAVIGDEPILTGTVDQQKGAIGDGVYATLSIDGSPIAAGPATGSGTGLQWALWLPTFDLPLGSVNVHLWLVPKDSNRTVQNLGTVELVIQPRPGG